ncbi:MAG: ABC transporter ATP-binding protein [Cyclobacteriaceae bacterium]
MFLRKFFLIRIMISIRHLLPSFVQKSMLRLLPIAFLLSVFEIFGLLIVIPVIQIILQPADIRENSFLLELFKFSRSSDETIFVMYLLGFIVLFFVVKNLIVYWSSLKQTNETFKVATRLTTLQFEKYLYQPYKFHVSDNSSIILRKIIEIPYNFTNGIMLPVIQFINEFIIALLIISGILVYNSVLFVSIILFVTPFFLLYVWHYKQKLRNVSSEREMGHSDMFKKGRQSIEGFREILLFDKFKYFIPKFNASVARFSQALAHLHHLNSFSPKIVETLAMISVLGIFFTGVVMEYDIAILASFLTTFTVAAYRLIPSVNKMILSYNNIRSSEFVFDHFRKVNWAKPTQEKAFMNHEEIVALPFVSSLQLNAISFGFDEKSEILKEVNFTIEKGQIIGIVGRSGSGKSTLINIILGLYEPSKGKVVIDDNVLNSSLMDSWHKTISYVPQNPVLVEGSILENIAFGVEERQIDKARLEWAVENSGLLEFINGLPRGLNSHIGDKSLNISGGQKQRIAIARALYHNGQLLIFDEATNSLDSETESLLTESIKKLAEQSYTVIIITHQMRTLKYCDWIYKINKGVISAPKKHEDTV